MDEDYITMASLYIHYLVKGNFIVIVDNKINDTQLSWLYYFVKQESY